jgi:hypothetical protein
MGKVVVLPCVLMHRTAFGTRIEWRRGGGLQVREPTGVCRPIAPAELRRCYPKAWPAWLRWAAMLPADEVARLRSGSPGGEAA